jgi:transposase
MPFRQGHKTDENDALAVADAACRPNIKLAPMKSAEQQGLQAIQRSRELLLHRHVALSNHIRGLLMEFGIVVPQGFAALYRRLPEILEDGENELPDLYRPTLNLMYRLKEPKTAKDYWLQAIIEHSGKCKAAVALANKNVRTAWAMLTQNTEYQRYPLAA